MISNDGLTPDMRRVELEHGAPGADIRAMLAARIRAGHTLSRIGRDWSVSDMTIKNWVIRFGLNESEGRELAGAGR